MKYKFYSCQDQYIQDNLKRIIWIAQKSFSGIQVTQIEERIKKYDEIIVAIDSKQIIQGFSFASLHCFNSELCVGARLVALNPKYRGKGLVRLLTFYFFLHYYKLILLRKYRKLIFFSRQCNPIAYKLLHINQEIFPDLIHKTTYENKSNYHQKKIYSFLKKSLNIQDLDTDTGVIKLGATETGFKSNAKNWNFEKKWQTHWHDYVGLDNELLVIFTIDLWFPLKHILKIINLGYKKLVINIYAQN